MDNFVHILLKAHSGIRYLVILFLVLALLAALVGWFSKGRSTVANRVFNTATVIFAHIQALLGVLIYFLAPHLSYASGNTYLKMEHISVMLIAVILITIGNSRSKKAVTTAGKHRAIAVFYGIGLLLIVSTILRMVQLHLLPSFFGAN